MLSEREKKFVEYWEANRLREKQLLPQLLFGIPMGLLFALPILIILFTGKLWYTRADMAAHSVSPYVMVVAVLIIAVFIAIFYKRHQWDMKEQQYLELKAREEKEKD
ncbi:MAG: hypothetical protein QM731_11050 [Chitinophagaceae bacterium]